MPRLQGAYGAYLLGILACLAINRDKHACSSIWVRYYSEVPLSKCCVADSRTQSHLHVPFAIHSLHRAYVCAFSRVTLSTHMLSVAYHLSFILTNWSFPARC